MTGPDPAPRGERMFVALPAGDLGEELLGAAQAALEPDRGALRFPRAAGLHLTLLFLDRIPAARVPGLADALGRHLAGAPAPRLRVDSAGAFPDPGAARVLWLGVSEERGGGLADLRRRVVAAVGESLADLPAPAAEAARPWRPHVTVARPRRGALRAPEAFRALAPGREWTPAEVALLASVPAPEGGPPRYLPRATFALG